MVANDAAVKGGAYYPVTVKKHLRAQEIDPIDTRRALGLALAIATRKLATSAGRFGIFRM